MRPRTDTARREESNPFSTRFTRPGAIEYVFDPGQHGGALVERLAALEWRAQIVGPHGSGKSTLLAQLVEPLEWASMRPIVFSLHDGQPRLPGDWVAQARGESARMIVIDGYEQLSRWSRFWLTVYCRRQGWGLLVTAHGEVGFQTLLRITPSLAAVQAIVDRLTRATGSTIDAATVARCFAAAHGNVREVLFALYDDFERKRRQS